MKNKFTSLISAAAYLALLIASPISLPATTVAYWRFEEGPADANVTHGGQPDGVFYPGVADSSGNGNALSVWAEGLTGYAYRTDRPATVIPQTGAANNFSVQNTGDNPEMFTQTGSHMQTMTPAAFTIEASFMPLATNTWRTIVGRDSQATTGSDMNLSALYFQITPENAVAIKFCDVSGYWQQAVSADGIVTGFPGDPMIGHWYHMAAVSDGNTLSLYLDSGFGYQLAAQTDMTLSGSPNTALSSGAGSGSDWVAGTWSVGCGLYAGAHTDRAYGFIDEVRISDSPLSTNQFLFAPALPNLVINVNDSGAGSLRQAVADATNGDTITFPIALSGTTILLTNGQIALNKNLTIDGSTLPAGITINGNHASRIFQVNSDVTVVLNSLTITNGTDTGGGNEGGGGILNYGTLTLNNCTLTRNSAPSSAIWGGGGILSYHGTLMLNQCTVAGNSANDGGGIFSYFSSTLALNQCTVAGNSADFGGGIYNVGSATINNSIVAGNTAPTYPNIYGSASVSLTGNNLTNSAPLLAPLGNYGGPTATMPPLPGSPAIDGCTNGTDFITDQRGSPRVHGWFADIGAVETDWPQTFVITTTNDDGFGSLRQAVANANNGDTITFSITLSGTTILLTNGQIAFDKNLTIDGSALPAGITINGNHASRIFQVNSGAIVVLNSLAITNGSADFGGGVINGGDLTVNNCTFSGNSATGAGGSIYNYASSANATVSINASTISGNTADWGGGIYNEGASGTAMLVLNLSSISDNSAATGGGGIVNYGNHGTAMITINTCTFSTNTGLQGAGINNQDGTVTISACTFSANEAETILNFPYLGSATLVIGDTILNAGFPGPNLDNYDAYSDYGTVLSDGYNLSSDDGGGFLTATGDQINTDPKLGPLQDNGGPAWTCALLPGSPAIDEGKRDAIPGLGLTTDQRGFARPVDFACIPNVVGGDGSDIGAFESQDTDTDGLPDDWELACFGNLNQTAIGDFDGDGQNNLFEYLAGTNPTNSASAFSLRAETVAGQPNQRHLIFSPWAGGRIYTPEFTTNLATTAFTPLTGYSATTNGAEVIITDLNATEGQKFYHIGISLP
jgi:Concanavalin A-like lectin/glucanases superfamily